MVAAVSDTINPKAQGGVGRQNPKRPPLLPSDPENALNPRRPKPREVVSRYLSTSSSSTSSSSSLSSSASVRRCPSPLVSRNSNTAAMATPMRGVPSAIKRSQSVERRRIATPRPNSPDLRTATPRPNSPDLRTATPRPNSPDLRTVSRSKGNGEMTDAQKLLLKSTRSLSVSFQGESYSIQTSKAKPAPSPSVSRKGTPERRKQTAATPARGGDQMENSKVWPGSLRRSNSMSRSIDCTEERTKLGRSGGNNVVRALQNSMVDNRPSQESRFSSASMNFDTQKKERIVAQIVASNSLCDRVASDTESVTSGNASGAQESNTSDNGEGKRGGQGIIVPARVWQETNNRLRRPASPVSRKTVAAPAKSITPKKFGLESPISSPKGVVNSRGLSPIRGPARPASPSKLVPSSASSMLRGVSPSRVRNGVISGLSSNLGSTQSFLGFAADAKRGKAGENRVVDAHLLRLLHNKVLQWRFINARADATHYVQRITAEESLYNAWISTTRLRDSVKAKRSELQLLRENLKLVSILKGQMVYLEEWALLDSSFSSSLSGAIEALGASTLRLPVVGGARADVRKLKDAICSAVNVMQAMASSVCSLMSKVGEVDSLLIDLAKLGANERAVLNQCQHLLSSITAMQVTECSLRTHIIQLQHLPSNLTTQT